MTNMYEKFVPVIHTQDLTAAEITLIEALAALPNSSTNQFLQKIAGVIVSTSLPTSVTSITAGSGISISASTGNITISATGGAGGSGTVTSASVVSANGFSGSVATASTTPAITIATTINSPILSGNGTALVAATTTGSGSTAVLSSAPTLTNPVVGTQSAGDNSTLAASTAFVTTAIANAVAAVNPAVAVEVASAAKLPNSPIYANGASGIGATITTLSTNTALVVDGYTLILGDRVLVKNEADSGGLGGAKNGVYVLSTLAALGVAWVLTRALDYDQSSDINNTGAIPVMNNGSTNGLTSWLLTSLVITVGTDVLTYTQFSYSILAVVSPTLGGTGIANNSAMTVTGSGNFAYTRTLTGITNVTFPTSGTLATRAGAETITNKRVQPRVYSAASNTSLTPEIDTYDLFHVTALAGNITINNHSTSTPTDGEQMRIRLLDNGTARTISWGNAYVAKGGTSLPSTTTLSKNIEMLLEYNSNLSKWNLLSVAEEA